MTMNDQYIPVWNIRPAEIKRRRQVGWLGLGLTILLWVAFLAFRIPAPWRLTLFFPAVLGAEGFLQAVFHFCAGFGSRGLFNFGSEVGKTETVEWLEVRRRDQRKARLIGLYSALTGIALAAWGSW